MSRSMRVLRLLWVVVAIALCLGIMWSILAHDIKRTSASTQPTTTYTQWHGTNASANRFPPVQMVMLTEPELVPNSGGEMCAKFKPAQAEWTEERIVFFHKSLGLKKGDTVKIQVVNPIGVYSNGGVNATYMVYMEEPIGE